MDSNPIRKERFKGFKPGSLMALRYFEQAAQLESFSLAANRFNLTHGAVSRAIRGLEEELGLSLFERRNRRVFLTQAGRRLQKAVQQGLGLIDQAGRDIIRDEQALPLVLSCEPTLLMRWLLPRWPDFQRRYPSDQVLLVAGGGAFSFTSGIDLALRRQDFECPDHAYISDLFDEEIGLVCSPEKVQTYFEQQGGQWRLRAQAPRLATQSRLHAWDDWFTLTGQKAGSGPQQIFEHFYFSLQAAAAGHGVAIGPRHLVKDDLRTGLLVAPAGFIADGSRYSLLTSQEFLPDSREARLLDWLREQLVEHRGG
ncbi:LysR family transcriptional regulator [Alcaligenes sp. SDU_A2]|uniref:LysR family transcriptional regulator n=1 Tax=Alcaligenes sp. SDU_A2 TaxID=3136634 RepID=UPI002BCD2310|nr:LysR family transcriptional regulator [Alcaligenes sp.]HRL26868.1 LysR family transcriptional regulator [Alcaligenes sp.]